MRWLLRMYPAEWRARYEDEMLALLEEHDVTPATVIDLMLGAMHAHLHYGPSNDGYRARSGAVISFCAFILFGAGWTLLQRLRDPLALFQPVDRLYPALGVLYEGVFILGCLAFVTFVLSGTPLVFTAVARAWSRRKRAVLAPFTLALSCLVTFVLSIAVLALWHPNAIGVLIGWLVLTALLLVAGTIATSLVIARADVHAAELRYAFIPEAVILFAMATCVALSTVLLVMITANAPHLLQTQDVSAPMFIAGITLMSIGTILGFIGIRFSRPILFPGR